MFGENFTDGRREEEEEEEAETKLHRP